MNFASDAGENQMTAQQLHDVMGELRQMIGQVQDNMRTEMMKMKEDLLQDMKTQIAEAKTDITDKLTRQIQLSKLEIQSGTSTDVKNEDIRMVIEGVAHHCDMEKTVYSDPVYIPLWGTYVRGCVAFDDENRVAFFLPQYKERNDKCCYEDNTWRSGKSKKFDLSLRSGHTESGGGSGDGAGAVVKEEKGEFDENVREFRVGCFTTEELAETGCLRDDTLSVVFALSAKLM